jgi:molecular chaperone GrpE
MKIGSFMSKHNNYGAGKNVPDSEKTTAQAEPSASEEKQAAVGENPEIKAEPSSAESGTKEEKSPEDKIAELKAQLAELNDQYLRKAADFENFRKRMNREKQDAIEYANQSLLLDLVQTLDDLDRALKSGEPLAGEAPGAAMGQATQDQAAREQAAKSFYEGVVMIGKRLSSQMENKWGLKSFNSAGEPFDPNRHEAMLMDKSPEITEPTVIEEYYKGYMLKERVIRHAQVKVLMPETAGNDGNAAK